jgi:hypothetical protein
MYIGSFFAVSMILMMLVKNYSSGFQGSKPVLFGGLFTIGAAGTAMLSTFLTDNMFPVFWALCGIFTIFGIIHILFFHKKYFYSNKNDQKKVRIGEILFALSLIMFAVVVFSALQYFLKDKSFMFYPMLISMLCFFIPILALYTFQAAINIPTPVFPTWHYPLHAPIDLPDERVNEKLVVIAFMIAKKAEDDIKVNFRAKGPESMVLGDLYYHFVNDYNDLHSETTIDYSDEEMNPHEWWFRLKPKWYQRTRILDPKVTIRNNSIKEDSIIICERLIPQQDLAT